MTRLGFTIAPSTIRKITRRAERLGTLIEASTDDSPHKEIRAAGAQLVDLLNEWVEEIRELHANDDFELEERLQSFMARLQIAEAKVATWPVPASLSPSPPRAANNRKRSRTKRSYAA